jgi:hypothetical protein
MDVALCNIGLCLSGAIAFCLSSNSNTSCDVVFEFASDHARMQDKPEGSRVLTQKVTADDF